MKYILTKGIYLHQDTNIQYTLPDLTRFVKSDSWYAPPFSKITYIDDDGNTQELIDDGLISTAYMMLLEKIGNDENFKSSFVEIADLEDCWNSYVDEYKELQ